MKMKNEKKEGCFKDKKTSQKITKSNNKKTAPIEVYLTRPAATKSKGGFRGVQGRIHGLGSVASKGTRGEGKGNTRRMQSEAPREGLRGFAKVHEGLKRFTNLHEGSQSTK